MSIASDQPNHQETGSAEADQELQVHREQDEDYVSPLRHGYDFYVVATVELPKDITGGPWYSEQEFDVGFVDAVSQFVGKVLAEEVRTSGFSHVASRTGHQGDSSTHHAE